VEAQWDQLSDAAKATLGPFLIPPMYEGSYVNEQIDGTIGSTAAAGPSFRDAPVNPDRPWCTGDLAIADENWHFVEPVAGPAAGKVRIWVQNQHSTTDDPLATSLMTAMQNKIWDKVTTLMGREPLPDGGSTQDCGGGSDALDIALIDIYPASTMSHTSNQEGTAAQMLFPRLRDNSPPYLAHEFTHAIQYGFTFSSGDMLSGENLWLRESTAQWMMDYVSSGHYGIGLTPDDQEKNYSATSHFFTSVDKPLDTAEPVVKRYSSYIFWLWATRKSNNTDLIKQVWNAVGTHRSIEAAKSIFGSGWDQTWRDFARTNWNQYDITDYQGWDSINETPAVAESKTLTNSFNSLVHTVAPVAAKYVKLTPAAALTGDLTYRNLGGTSDKAGIQALIKYKDGTYGVEDWTNVTEKDVPMCDKDEITLVLSNSSVTQNDSRAFVLSFSPPSPSPRAATPRAGGVCLPDPQGSFSGTAHYDDTVTTVMDWSWSGNVEFDYFGLGNPWFPEYSTELWDTATVTTGSVTMGGTGTVEGSDGTCSITVPPANYAIDANDGGYISIQPGEQPHYGIQVNFPADEFPSGTVSCPGDDPYDTLLPVPGTIVYTPEPAQSMTRSSYQGSSTFSNPFYVHNTSWNFTDPLN